MHYWTYTPKNAEAFNEKLRVYIAQFPKGEQSQKQASSHYDGYNHPKSLNINYPEFQMRRGYASWYDANQKTGYVNWKVPPIDPDPHQQYKTVFWESTAPLLHEFSRDVAVRAKSGLNYQIFVDVMWFHQMYEGDYDNWHNHFACQWIGIYYVDLPKGEETELMDFDGNIFVPEVKEGELLIFPSGYLHRSPPKKVKQEKTIIAFNFSVASKYSREMIQKLQETHPQNYFEDVKQISEFKE
jgi:hypothetical protein